MNCRNNKLSAREAAEFLCKHVRVDLDDVSEHGKLVCVGRDFIALKTDEWEVLYFPLNNVRAITIDTDKGCHKTDCKKICNDTFRSILRKLINCKVRVNDGSDDEIVGVLTDVNRQTIQIVRDDEIVMVVIGFINFIAQAGEWDGHESSHCRILCCKKEDPCGKKKCFKKESSSKCCKRESSSYYYKCKKESSSSSSCIVESSSSSCSSTTSSCSTSSSSSCSSSSSSSWWKKESSSEDWKKKKHHKKRNSADLESRGWFKL
ncbi:hypothetical protein KUV80_08895 [Fictibacillus nanhaiensis]|uniref:hypothetical protein n=1 Tax=Fictibacillus nanhaiensis TaxID=742169 RepID=UPI001C93E37B|nr:hypothetical protein [Fictibacillus nanhaiensis]MBY6036769.1 hypothetical protein [Fictibacillus nanhaiensis]